MLLGEQDTIGLGVVKLHPQGAAVAVSPDKPESKAQVSRRSSYPEQSEPHKMALSQAEIDANMKKLISQFPVLFSAKTGKFHNATPMTQPSRRIPLHYIERVQSEINKMPKDDITRRTC